VVVCVKPKHLKDVLVELKPALEPRHLLVSVVTGISINEMIAIIGTPLICFRFFFLKIWKSTAD
jgi:pyrroline-5-carboxylate reductase